MFSQASSPQSTMIPSVVNPETQELVKRGRVKSAAQLAAAHQQLWTADWQSSRSRALAQSMVDGAPPFSTGRDAGLSFSGRANVNWGLGSQALEEARMPYNNILDELDVFGQVPTKHGTKEQQAIWNPIISEEITRMLKNWEDFDALWQQNNHLFVMEGLSFAFFEDKNDWRWKIYGMQFLKFPRRIPANINKIGIMTCQVDMLPSELYDKVRNVEAAEDEGWNRNACLEAIKETCASMGLPSNDPQEWERAWVDNDIIWGITNEVVKVVHGFVRELDGTVSHYISRYDGNGEFLYKCEGKFRCMAELVCDYKYGVGANGDFQSIRGLGQKIFASCGAINRLMCKYLDMALHVSTPHLINKSEDTIQENAIRPVGPYAVMMDGLEFAEQKIPPFDQTLEPAIDKLERVFRMRSQPYAAAPAQELDKTQRTKYEMQIKAEQSGKLTTSGMRLFFQGWGTHFKEVVRRIKREDYSAKEPGGQQIWEMRKRCVARGVPLEAIYEIDIGGIEVNMGFGKGSVGERRAVVSVFNEVLYARADAYAKNKINNLTAAAFSDTGLANDLFPLEEGLRPPNATVHAAMSENNDAALGQPIFVILNDDHQVHLQIHLQRLQELNGALENQQIQLEEAIPQMSPIWQHSNEHLELMDPMVPEAKQFKEALQQLGEVVTNGQKHLDAEAERAAKEAGTADPTGAGEGYGGTPASEYKQVVQAQAQLAKLDLDVQRKRTDLEFDTVRKKQQLAFEDAKGAQKLRFDAAQQRLKQKDSISGKRNGNKKPA